MSSIRERAKEILSQVPEPPQQITSDGPTASLFTKLTGGVLQSTLEANWAKGGIMTSCNEFVGWYGAQLGSKEYLGRFDLETYLPKISKAYAWIPSTEDGRPKYGDICRHTAFHVGISLDFVGDNWNHVDAGQGGPKAKHDILKRTQGKGYDYTKLQGWIDLDLYFLANLVIPDWLVGWWKVTWRGQSYYYVFSRNHQVKWTPNTPREFDRKLNNAKPSQALNPLFLAADIGTFGMDVGNTVVIRWRATGSLERLTKTSMSEDSMRGTWNDTEQLTAVKL